MKCSVRPSVCCCQIPHVVVLRPSGADMSGRSAARVPSATVHVRRHAPGTRALPAGARAANLTQVRGHCLVPPPETVIPLPHHTRVHPLYLGAGGANRLPPFVQFLSKQHLNFIRDFCFGACTPSLVEPSPFFSDHQAKPGNPPEWGVVMAIGRCSPWPAVLSRNEGGWGPRSEPKALSLMADRAEVGA